ncbi:MAG TPA: LysR family transcriptional regulator [Archangium sp.]|uniref:helix-turn-helix domain-containing protein n=1 Tax=Archangium sp. TaxID=1872627 RepID=UPI002E2FA8A9|nr:LysR family transcriptional regulator [Archangium sp.]HEX5747747.1 LysR family transcriptional regulator [Archangium sp.]
MAHIQSFVAVAVAEERNVGRAARRLHPTQPPLSRHLLALESKLGTRLFERTPGGLRLLPAGEKRRPSLPDHEPRRFTQERLDGSFSPRERSAPSGTFRCSVAPRS